MIIKSSQRSHAKQLSRHLISNENEGVSIIQSNGIVSGHSIATALAEMEAISKASRCIKYIYHVSASPDPRIKMTDKEWKYLWLLHDKIQGTKGLTFIEVEHIKKNRIHRHRVYLRVNSQTGLAINLAWTRIKNERICRQLEVQLGHPAIQGKHNKSVIRALKNDGLHDIAERLVYISKSEPAVVDMTHAEWQQDKREKALKDIRKDLYICWENSTDTKTFFKELKTKGYVIAQGDKVPVAVNAFDKEYPLLRSINVVRKKEGKKILREKELMSRLPDLLPYVEAVREKATEYELVKQKASELEETSIKVSDIKLNEYIDSISSYSTPRSTTKNKIVASTKRDDSLPSFKNFIQPNSQIQQKWLLYRKQLLQEQYETIDLAPFAIYWKISRINGSIIFKNESGKIIDHGERISTDSTNFKNSAELMVMLAISKKWDELIVSGADDFKLSIYKEAMEYNITCKIDNDNDKHIWMQAVRERQKDKRSPTL